ncbi:reticulocyte-binding protein homolog 2b-like [Haliotis asinina]|uniref:reticulocyte-binding protein homolog 2b-like n=1 Tax=Haliotis asinina TaxID=109174 RepID=UPI0035325433
MANNNPSEKPIWQRRAPAIPVRENRRSRYLKLASMHGDHLPQLRKQDRPEISDEARHFDTMSDAVMMKHVNIMYKEHQHVIQKLTKDQDAVYKMMCRVQKEKRKIQRAECARRQEEMREKMKSERVRTLMKRAVAKFRENVQRRKKERVLAEQRKQEEKKAKRERRAARKASVAESSGNTVTAEGDSVQRGDVKVQEKEHLQEEHVQEAVQENKHVQEAVQEVEQMSEKTQDLRKNPDGERRGSLTRNEEETKSQVEAVENTERYHADGNDTIVDDDGDQTVLVRTSRVLEVSKTSSEPVTRTKGDENDQSNLLETLVTVTCPDPQDSETALSEDKTEETESHAPEGAAANDGDDNEGADGNDNFLSTETDNSDKVSRRPSLFGEDAHDPDLGWFTYGNPHVPLSPNYINISVDVLQEIVADDPGAGTDDESLPPLRVRRAPLVPPPSSYLKEQLRLSENKNLTNNDSGVGSFQGDSTDSNLNAGEMADVSMSPNDSMGSCPSSLTAAGRDRGCLKQQDRSSVSSAGSVHSSPKSDLAPDESVREIVTLEVPMRITSDRGASLPLKPRKKKPHTNADKHLSANMMWVLKQEQKSRREWKKRMTEDDKVIQYYKTADGRYIATVVDKRKHFLAPSFKEYHRQQKLLVGEKVKADDFADRMAELMKIMTLNYGMDSIPVIVPTPSPEHKKRQQPSDTQLPSFSYGAVFDEYRQRDLMVEGAEPGSYEAMKGVAYLRVNDEKYKPARRRDKKLTTWNQR